MPRFALVLAYDGSAYNGWQSQPHGNGVQDHVQLALSKVADHPVQVTCAGRTDTGVHATAQVIHFDTEAPRKPGAWTRGLNSHLPSGIAAQQVREVAPDFHARFDARRRRYHYLILRAPMRQPLLHQRAAWVFQPVDVPALTQASRCLLGVHDFSSFRSSECQAKTPVRDMQGIMVREQGALLSIEFIANGFLHHMIRNIVGALIQVGVGKQPVDWMASLLQARDRRLGAPTFAPEGLYFTGVAYAPGDPLNELTWPVAALPGH